MNKKQALYHVANNYMTRMPMLPYQIYDELFSGTEETFEKTLREFCENKLFREAILVASETLYKKMDDYLAGKIENKKKLDDFKISILKYIIRMSTRTTPFGAFSRVGIGEYRNMENTIQNTVVLSNNRVARVDFEWLMLYIKKIEKDKCSSLEYSVNRAISVKGERICLPYITGSDEVEVSMRNSAPVDTVIRFCKNTTYTFEELLKELREKYLKVDINKLENFLKELVEKEVLISNLRPPLNIDNQMEYLQEQLNRKEELEEYYIEVKEINDLIKKYNQTRVGEGEEQLDQLVKKMKLVQKSAEYLQVDTYAQISENYLSENIKTELEEVVDFIFEIATLKERNNTIFDEYRLEFLEKYGEDREVPLYEVIDNDWGLGAPYSYMHPCKSRLRKKPERNEFQRELNDYLWNAYREACEKKSAIVLDQEIYSYVQENKQVFNKSIPLSLELNFITRYENGRLRYYLGPNIGSTAAGKTFGRFAYLNREIKMVCNQLNEEEKNAETSDVIFCELAYIPQKTRYTNVARSYSKRDYEISLYTNGSKNTEYEIPLNDIYIGVEEGHFYLKSRNLDKRICIRTNNMLNVMGDANIIRFLKEIESDSVIEWSDFPWNNLFGRLPYVPEIRYKNFVLAPETWRISKKVISKNEVSYEIFSMKLDRIIKENKIPRFVYITEADNKLKIDVKNEWCRKIMYKTLKKEDTIILTACEDGKGYIYDREEREYNCEMVIPFIKNKRTDDVQINFQKSKNILNVSRNDRLKMLGSEWTYFKVFGCGAWMENLIVYYLSPFATELLNNKLIDEYFFMRYADPEPHIRIRFKSDNAMQNIPKYAEWLSNLCHEKVISRYEVGCYEREIERYGGIRGIDIAEEVFYMDSRIAEKILLLKKEEKIKYSDEVIGIVSTIMYMEQYGWDFEQQLCWLNSFIKKEEYKIEYNKNRKLYEKVCNSSNSWNNFCESEDGKILKQLFDARQTSVNKYREEINRKSITTDERIVIAGLIHLSFNRLFGMDREFERKVMAFTRHTLYSLRYVKEKINEDNL